MMEESIVLSRLFGGIEEVSERCVSPARKVFPTLSPLNFALDFPVVGYTVLALLW